MIYLKSKEDGSIISYPDYQESDNKKGWWVPVMIYYSKSQWKKIKEPKK